MRIAAFLFLAAAAFAEPVTMRYAIGEFEHVLDPHLLTAGQDAQVANALFEGLAYEDPKTQRPMPGVAKRWDVSKDGKVWTFHLRKDAKWSNGESLSARDFHWSWKRALSPKMATEYGSYLWVIAGAEAFTKGKSDFSKVGIEVVDRHTLRVTLSSAAPYFAHILTQPIAAPVHRLTVEEFEEGWTRPENIVTNGPFLLAAWSRGAFIRLEKSPVYWNAATIRLDRIDALMRGESAALFAFVNGQLHWNPANWPATAAPAVRKHPGFRTSPSFTTYFYRFNVRKKHLADARVRRAISHAIDRKDIVENVTRQGEVPAYTLVPPGIPGYASPAGLRHDPAVARKLMAEAGYPGGKGFPPLDLLHNESAMHAAIARRVAAQLKRTLGIETFIAQHEWYAYQVDMRAGKYDVARGGWIGDWPDPSTFLDLSREGPAAHTGYASPFYDRLQGIARDMPAFLAAPDDAVFAKIVEGKRLRGLAAVFRWREARMLVLKEMERLLVERDCPIVPVYFYVERDLVHPKLRGFYPNPRGVHPLRGFWIEG